MINCVRNSDLRSSQYSVSRMRGAERGIEVYELIFGFARNLRTYIATSNPLTENREVLSTQL